MAPSHLTAPSSLASVCGIMSLVACGLLATAGRYMASLQRASFGVVTVKPGEIRSARCCAVRRVANSFCAHLAVAALLSEICSCSVHSAACSCSAAPCSSFSLLASPVALYSWASQRQDLNFLFLPSFFSFPSRVPTNRKSAILQLKKVEYRGLWVRDKKRKSVLRRARGAWKPAKGYVYYS